MDDETLVMRSFKCEYGKDLRDAWWFKPKYPLGKGGEWDRDDNLTYYVSSDKQYARFTAWDRAARVAVYRASHCMAGWCDCHWFFYWELYMAKFVQAARKAQSTTKKGAEASCSVLLKRCPAVHEFLTLTVIDGKPRETSSVSIFAEGGRWKASLADKDAECSVYVTADTPDGLWDALEAALTGSDTDWRAWRQGGGKGGKKK